MNINDSDALNGFDITLKADTTVLKPFDADLTGSILSSIGGTIQVLRKCIGVVPVVGTSCASTSTSGTIELATGVQGGTGVTLPPTSGLLFTAVFSIVGNVTTGTSSVGFQTGCGTVQNPTSNPPNCVTIENGSAFAVPENLMTAAYSTSKTGVPYFHVSGSPTSVTFVKGVAGTKASTIALIENDTFSCGGINCVDVSFLYANSTGPTASVSPPSITDGGTTTLTITTTKFVAFGTYIVYVVGHADTSNTPLSGNLYMGTFLTVTIHVSDFNLTVSVSTLTIKPGTSVTATVTVSSLNSFSGTVALSTSISPAIPTTTLTPTSVTVSAAGSATSTLNITMPATSQTGPFIITIKGAFQSASHSTTLSVSPGLPVISITLAVSASSAKIGDVVKITVTVQNTGTAAGNLLLGVNWGSVAVAGPTNVTINAGATQTIVYNWTTTGFNAGNFNLTAVATGGNLPSSQSSTPSALTLTSTPPSLLSGNLIWIVVGIVAAIIVIVAITLLVRRRGKKPSI